MPSLAKKERTILTVQEKKMEKENRKKGFEPFEYDEEGQPYQGKMGDGLSSYGAPNIYHECLSVREVFGRVYDEIERSQEIRYL